MNIKVTAFTVREKSIIIKLSVERVATSGMVLYRNQWPVKLYLFIFYIFFRFILKALSDTKKVLVEKYFTK